MRSLASNVLVALKSNPVIRSGTESASRPSYGLFFSGLFTKSLPVEITKFLPVEIAGLPKRSCRDGVEFMATGEIYRRSSPELPSA